MALLALACLGGCALSHARSGANDAGTQRGDAALEALLDAPSPRDAQASDARSSPCGAREEHVLTPPPARRARHSILLQLPRVSSDGARVAALALVVSASSGGLGVSDILTYAYDGSEPRAHFTSEVPYLLGSSGVPDEFLAGGGFTDGTRVYAESRRFDVTSFTVLRADDLVEGVTERHEVAIDPTDPNVPYVEVAREAPIAVRVGGRGSVLFHALAPEGSEPTRGPEGAAVYLPTPRLSPSGRRLAYVSGGDRSTLHVFDVGEGDSSHVLPDEAAALAFLGEELVLVLGRHSENGVDVLDLRDGAIREVSLGLPALDDRFFEGIDVSDRGETFVVSEAHGERVRVLRCDPSLVALARGS